TVPPAPLGSPPDSIPAAVSPKPPSGARAESATDFRRESTTGLEPLPGETLSKWQRRGPVVESQTGTPDPPAEPEAARPASRLPEAEVLHDEELEQEAHQLQEAQAANE